MANLLPVLTTYYPVFASQFCQTDEQTKAVMAQYAERLLVEKVDAAGLERGLEALKRRAATERFAPNPSEFAAMCKPAPAELGLPDLDTVLLQIIERNGACAGVAYQFGHPLTQLISQRKGALLRELTGMAFAQVIKSEYDHWVKHLQAGEPLPEPQLAISHDKRPEMPAHLRMAPKSAMALRVEALRAEAAARKAQ